MQPSHCPWCGASSYQHGVVRPRARRDPGTDPGMGPGRQLRRPRPSRRAPPSAADGPGRGEGVALVGVRLLADQKLITGSLPGGKVDDGRAAGERGRRVVRRGRHGVLRASPVTTQDSQPGRNSSRQGVGRPLLRIHDATQRIVDRAQLAIVEMIGEVLGDAAQVIPAGSGIRTCASTPKASRTGPRSGYPRKANWFANAANTTSALRREAQPRPPTYRAELCNDCTVDRRGLSAPACAASSVRAPRRSGTVRWRTSAPPQ